MAKLAGQVVVRGPTRPQSYRSIRMSVVTVSPTGRIPATDCYVRIKLLVMSIFTATVDTLKGPQAKWTQLAWRPARAIAVFADSRNTFSQSLFAVLIDRV